MTYEEVLGRLGSIERAMTAGTPATEIVPWVRGLRADLDVAARGGPLIAGGPSGIASDDLAGMAERLGPAVKSALKAKKKGLFGFALTPALIMIVVNIVVQLIAAYMKRDAAFALPLYQARSDEFDVDVVAAVEASR